MSGQNERGKILESFYSNGYFYQLQDRSGFLSKSSKIMIPANSLRFFYICYTAKKLSHSGL